MMNGHGYEKVENGGMDVYYRVFGEGTPLLVLGGGPGDVSDRYLSLCELLSATARCLLVDQRGTGRSRPEAGSGCAIDVESTLGDFEAVRKREGLESWHVLGFSYGGFLASAYAEAYPSSIRSLVLLDSSGLDDSYAGHFFDNISSRMTPEDVMQYEYWCDRAGAAPEGSSDRTHAVTEAIRAMMPGYFFDRKKSLAVSQAIRDGDFDLETGARIDADIAARNLYAHEGEPAFKGPALVLHGRQDPLGESVPLVLSRRYAPSTLSFIEKAGHYSWIEQPEAVLKSVSEFLSPSRRAGAS